MFERFRMPARLHAITAALAITASLPPGANAQAAPYDDIVFFGDSLTDSGALEVITVPILGTIRSQPSFTTNPDKIWAARLAGALNGGDAASSVNGGSNYAVGGARILTQEQYPNALTALFITPVKDQISHFLTRQPNLNPHGLYAIWAGANDVLNSLQTQKAALQDPATTNVAAQRVLADAALAAAAGLEQIARLRAAGAGTVLALNLPDIGSTPLGYASPEARPLMRMATQQFNDTLNRGLADDKGDLILLDIHVMFDELTATPARYGLLNVTQPACSTDSNACDRSKLTAPDANRTYLFADSVHPTGIGHELIADYALSVMQAPARIGLLAEAPLAGNRVNLRAIEERLRNRGDSPVLQAYAAYQHDSGRQRDNGVWQPGADNRMNTLNVGVDGGVGPHWLLGAGLAQVQHDATLGGRAGSFRLDQTQLSAYARYRLAAWSAALIGSIGYLDYRKVSRDFSIGPASLREQGKTTGTVAALSALTHYDWRAGIFTLTPSAGLTLQSISVDGYNESRDGGRTATSMNYHDQRRRSLVSTLGLRLQADLRHGDRLWQPYAGLAWEHEFKRHARHVRAHVRDMTGSFSQRIAAAPADSALVSAGLRYSNGGAWSGQAGYYGRYGSGQRSHAVQASIAYSF